MKKIQTIGKLSKVMDYQRLFPKLSYGDIEVLLNGRSFVRWYKRNQKVIDRLAVVAPVIAYATISALLPGTALFTLLNPSVATATIVQQSFFGGKGAILLHMLVVGFFTLVVSTFMKFTGRGDMIPLVMFVGGAIILYEVIGLFNDIYSATKALMSV